MNTVVFFAALFAGLIFGGVSRLSGGNQRLAILAVGAMFVAGLALMSRVRAGGPPPRAVGPTTDVPAARPDPGARAPARQA